MISIIMCVYNSEKYLFQSIKSILSQTYSDFELIIIDDGSTDASYKIIEDISKLDNRINHIRIKNSGPANARNVGLSMAQGQYVLFCDSDDELNSNMLQELYNSAIINNAQIACCGYNMIVQNKKKSFIKQFLFKDIITKNRKELSGILPELMKNQLVYVVWNKLYNLQFLKDNNAHFPNMAIGEDRFFNIELLMSTERFSFINKTLYNYKIYSTGMTLGQFYYEKFNWVNQINKVQFNLFKQLKILNEENTRFLNYLYFRMIISTIIQIFSKKCTLNYDEKRKYIFAIIKSQTVISACNYNKNYSTLNNIIIKIILSGNVTLNYYFFYLVVLVGKFFNKFFIKLKYESNGSVSNAVVKQ